MKALNLKKNVSRIIAIFAIVGQILISSIAPVVTNASIIFPEKVTIEYDMNRLYTLSGTLDNGTSINTKITPLFAVYEGIRQAVFCIEPGIPIDNPVMNGYTSNPLPEFANKTRAKLISTLWKYVGTDADIQITAGAMVWAEVRGLKDYIITKPDGTILNYEPIVNSINQLVNDYIKKPSFSGQTVKINLGESTTLTDLDNVGLSRFDNVALNTAKVDWSVSGNKLTITPKIDSNVNGILRFAKNLELGTPVAYQLLGQQTVMAGAIDDPNWYQNNIVVVTTGEVKITKLDKGTGQVVPNTAFKVEFDGKSQTVKTDDKGEAIVKDIFHDTKVKVTETFVPAPYILDASNTKEVIVKAGNTASVEFKNERATGKSTLTKVDKTTETNEPLNPTYPMLGAKYGWFKEDGTLLKEFTLGEDLTATIDKQELGNYYWQETFAPVGYTLDQTKHIVELIYKDQYTPVVVKDADSKDDVIRMNLDGQKLIQNETNEMLKNGVEFTLTNKRTGETHVVTTATLDGKKGYFRFADIALDDYVLTETEGVEGYNNVDPIEITHSYDKEKDIFTFVVKDQKSKNVLNEEKLTQLELSEGVNVDLGTYTLKDKAVVNEEPIVGIGTQAHTGDSITNSFEWGENVKPHDDVKISHKNIAVGTDRAFEAILVAVYPDKTEKDVWESGKIDYKVTDAEITKTVIAEYDYKKDPKGTRYYWKEIGFNKPSEKEYVEDTKHNFDGKEKTQDWTPVVKEEPKTPETPKQPKPSLPKTGEQLMKGATVIGLALIAGVAGATYLKRKKTDESKEKNEEMK